MNYKVFIDGASGTTGLKIHEYFKLRQDIEVLSIDYEKRHDVNERVALIKQADISFLCLPDDAAREIAAAAPKDSKILDTSTAHRTDDSWAYGMPEIAYSQRDRIKNSNRVAVPGCHATGAILLMKPLLANGLLPSDYPFAITSLTGYSGGGKKMIAQYEDEGRGNIPQGEDILKSPRQYGISQTHKHLPEIMKATGATVAPAFMPIVADYYSGMEVSIPIKGTEILRGIINDPQAKAEQEYIQQYGTKKFVAAMIMAFYKDQPLVSFVESIDEDGFIAAGRLARSNRLEISVVGNDENIVLVSTFDNLGKGASGAAIQNMNIMLGLNETTGLI